MYKRHILANKAEAGSSGGMRLLSIFSSDGSVFGGEKKQKQNVTKTF